MNVYTVIEILEIVNLLGHSKKKKRKYLSYLVLFSFSQRISEEICDQSLTDRCFTTAYTWAIPNAGCSYRLMEFTGQFQECAVNARKCNKNVENINIIKTGRFEHV